MKDRQDKMVEVGTDGGRGVLNRMRLYKVIEFEGTIGIWCGYGGAIFIFSFITFTIHWLSFHSSWQ
jgi:hypothetical protein